MTYVLIAVLASTLAIPLAPAAAKESAHLALSLPPFVQTMSQLHAAYNRKTHDQFAAEPPNLPADGESFRITVPVRSHPVYAMAYPASYDYTEGKLMLQLFTSSYFYLGLSTRSIQLFTRETAGRSYIGQNGFGARTGVSVTHRSTDSIAYLDLASQPAETYVHEIPVNGTTARAIALDTNVVLEGHYQHFPKVNAIYAPADPPAYICRDEIEQATLDDPTEVSWQDCALFAVITRVAFERRSTGEILREWTAKK